jgi:hypothetical protein
MDLNITAVSQLLNSAVSTAKTIREFAKDSSDTTLKSEIHSLYDMLLDIKAKVLDLDEENRTLKAQLALKDDIEGPTSPHGYFHRKSKPNNPLCPKCLQSKDKQDVFLSEVTQFAGGRGRKCVVCNFLYIEDGTARVRTAMPINPFS